MSTLPFAKDELSINIKILNCRNLLIGDTVSSDPYVTVLLGKKELHKTKHLMKTLNPSFGTKDKNEFELQFFWRDVTKKGGLKFEVKDWDLVGKDDFIGFCKISPSDILKMALSEAPTTVQLKAPPNMRVKEGKDAGSITISIRHTSARGSKSKYWAPARASVVARRSTLKNPDENVSSEEESVDPDASAPDYNKELFIEIISCKSLIARDANGLSDPYVKVQMGERFLHRTSVIKKTLNPAFTAEHKNSFILDCDALHLWEADGIKLLVKDHDDGIAAFGHTNVELGSAKVPPGKLYQASGANMKIKLTPPKDSKEFRRGLPAGSITIRIREATAEDRHEIKDRSNVFKKTKKAFANPNVRAKKFIPEVDLTGIEKKILLVEVLSCRELLAADKNGFSDPYVLAKLGFKDIHKTNYIRKTLNPVFTEKHKNSFVVDCSVSELFGANGMLIKVIDWDRGIISADDELGSVQIPATTLYECREEEYHLEPPSGRNDDAGYIRIKIIEISEEQLALYKRGKIKSSRALMPAGLSTSESGFSNDSQFSLATSASSRTAASLDFKDMPDKILLVEILSCRNLIAADKNGLSDPYVKAKMGKKDLHKTKTISKTLNPVFTSVQKNSFLISCPKLELAGAQGILVRVVDWDRGLGGDDDLGWVQIQAESLYECQLQEYALNAPYGRNEDAGYVTIRTTELTEEERAQHVRGKLVPLPPPPPPAPPSEDDSPVFSGSSPTSVKDPWANAKSTNLDDTGVRTVGSDFQDRLKPPFDPDAKFFVEEEKKFRMLVAAVVVSSVVLVFLMASGVTGRSARSGEPKLDILEQVGKEVTDPHEVRNMSIPGASCDVPGWTDSYGYGCEYYMENKGDCERYAGEIGSNGKGPVDACCVCQKASRSNCVDLPGWIDFYEDSCDWYVENEPIGCPGEGHVNGTNNVSASEACCHCHPDGIIINEREGLHGKLSDGAVTEDTFFSIIPREAIISLIVAVAILLLCVFCCCCCF